MWSINCWYLLISPCAAYMRRWTGSLLFQVMVCRQFSAKPLPEPMLTFLSIAPLRTNFSEILIKIFKNLRSWNCISKCRQRMERQIGLWCWFSDIRKWFSDIRKSFFDIRKSIPDIRKCVNFWYQKMNFWYKKIIFWYPKLFSDIRNYFLIS